MLVASVETSLISYDFPFARPNSLQRATQPVEGWESREGVLVRLRTDDGQVGHGYAHGNAVISGETNATIRAALEVFVNKILGQDARDLHGIMSTIDRCMPYNYRAKASIDMALHDLLARALGIPLFALLRGASRSRVGAVAFLGMDSPEATAKRAANRVHEGFRAIKLKVGDDPILDVKRIRAVREGVGDGIRLIVDPNQAYSAKTAIGVLNEVDDCDVFLIEQPVPARDLHGLALVRRSVRTLVEADESVRCVDDAKRVVDSEACDSISLKLQKLGGIRQAERVMLLCQSAGVRCRVGGVPGPSILEAASVHLAAAHGSIEGPCELGDFLNNRGDPTSGLTFEEGAVLVPQGPGLGITLSNLEFEPVPNRA